MLKGAKFEIIDLSGNKIGELETGADGIATYENLPYGEYKLVEVQPPVGYKILNPEKSFNINEQGQIVNLQFENQLIVGQVVIEKVDSENENIKLADVKFQIKDVKGNIVESIVTDEKGIGSVNLVPGDYTLTEIKAPNGYQLLASPIEIKINVDGTAIVDGKNVEVDKDSNNIQLHIGNSKFLEILLLEEKEMENIYLAV